MSNKHKHHKNKQKSKAKTRPDKDFKAKDFQTKALKETHSLYGLHALEAGLKNPRRHIRKIYITSDHPFLKDETLAPFIEKIGYSLKSKAEITALIGNEDAVHQNILAEVEPLAPRNLNDHLKNLKPGQKGFYLMLDQVSDPHNIGAILRSACAFGALGVIVQDKHAPRLNATICKIASGAAEHIDLIAETNLARALDSLKETGFWAIALDEKGPQDLNRSLSGLDRAVLVMGAEGPGLRPLILKSCDLTAHLPTSGNFSSLNVSNAAAISLYEAAKMLKTSD